MSGSHAGVVAAASLGLIACTAASVGLTACAAPWREPVAGDNRAHVEAVVTIYPLAQLLGEIGGERVEVATLLPPGASPHAYEPIPSDLVRLARATLLVSVGGGIDSWAAPLLAAGGNDPRAVVLYEVDAGLRTDLDEQVGHDDRDSHGDVRDHGHAHDHRHGHGGATDPHVWLDPVFVAEHAVPALTAALVELDPDARAYYQTRSDALVARLRALDRDIRTTLSGIDGRAYIAFHSAWSRFAARYGLSEAGVVEEAGGEEPTPREIVALIRAARASHIGAILVEPQMPKRIAEIIAAEFGGATVLVDPLGDPDDATRSTYVAMMEFNAQAFARALAGGIS